MKKTVDNIEIVDKLNFSLKKRELLKKDEKIANIVQDPCNSDELCKKYFQESYIKRGKRAALN